MDDQNFSIYRRQTPQGGYFLVQLNLRKVTTLCARKSGLRREVVSHGRYSRVIKGRDRPTQTPNPCLCMPSCHHQKPCLSLEFMFICIEWIR